MIAETDMLALLVDGGTAYVIGHVSIGLAFPTEVSSFFVQCGATYHISEQIIDGRS